MFKFEELRVYQEALLFVDFVYQITNKWPSSETFGLTSQLRRASVSIVLNIAEGTSRTKKDFRHFLTLSRGSCFEYVAIFTIVRKQKLLTEEEFNKAYEWCNKIARMTTALKRSIL